MTYVLYAYLIGAFVLLLFSAYMAIGEYISKSKTPTLDELRSIWFSVSLWPAVMPVVAIVVLRHRRERKAHAEMVAGWRRASKERNSK